MMLPAFRYMLGSSMGSGRQWMSWIHQEDLFNIFSLLLSDSEISGPVNCVSPNPVRNAEFAKILARTLGRPLVLPAVPAFLLRTLLGEFANVVLKGPKGHSKKIDGKGLFLPISHLQQALENLIE